MFFMVALPLVISAPFGGPGFTPPSRLMYVRDVIAFDASNQWETVLRPDIDWNEAVVSWNASLGQAGRLRIEASPDESGEWFTLGIWTDDKATRQSVNDQGGKSAEVQTDTLVTKSPARTLRLRLIGSSAHVEMVTVSFANRAAPEAAGKGTTSAWGATLEPPRRAQMSYPNGKVICSATATSMLLGYWANRLDRPELDRDVPRVCDGVFDPKWPGTGNWPFNTAFAGSLPGMQGYVARLWNVEQLEAWIERGIPVACSVSYGLLQGKEKGKNDGHIVVLVGFTDQGDPVFNDPGKNAVRMTYRRADFAAAWASSGRTCYMVHPEYFAPPANVDQCWVD